MSVTVLKKFIPFAKVDEAKREVWGIVTAEVPDKDGETCRYEPTKRNYKTWSAEFSKATDGDSLGNLREMHQLKAVGRGVGMEFRDDDKEIWMGFKVVDNEAWNKVVEKVYTGFSQGGEYQDGPDANGFYTANPSEVSLVDNPCLGVAHFAFIRTSGAVELVKIRSIEKVKTKSVAGEELPPGAFAYVGDPEDTSTWKLPIKFSTTEKTASHVRNALARFNQTQGIPAEEKARVKARIVAAARAHGIDVSTEKTMDEKKVAELIEAALAKALGKDLKNGLDKAAHATMHGHLKKALEHGAKAMEHFEAAKEAHEDGNHEEAEGHLGKGMAAHEKCQECMGKCMKAMGHEPEEEDDEEEGMKDEKEARKMFAAGGLEGAALEKAVNKYLGKAEVVTAEQIGTIIEEKMSEMLKAMFGKEDDEKPKPQQTHRVTKTEDNGEKPNPEIEALKAEIADLKKARGSERVHDPEAAAALAKADKGEQLTQDEAFGRGLVSIR